LASSVPTARRFVQSVLSSWGESGNAWDCALLVSELAANCVLHARTDFSVRVTRSQDRILVEVEDASPRIPQPRKYGANATTGRGLQLVQSLGAEWGVTPTDGGKRVWVELARSSRDDDGTLESADDTDLDLDQLLATFSDDPGGPVARHPHAA
jgi:anti-sigma regulatory factor (Ser/Thr protein kinase)